MYLHAARHRALGVTPCHRIVPRQCAGRMIERAEDGVADLLRHVQGGAQAADLVGIDHLGIDAQMLVHFGAPARGAHCGVGVREGEMPALRIHDVDVDLFGEAAKQLDGFLVKGDAFRREIVCADDRCVARRVAAAQPCLVEHGNIADAVTACEIEGGRKPVSTGADDDDVVILLELRLPAELRRIPVTGIEAVFQQGKWQGSTSARDCAGDLLRVPARAYENCPSLSFFSRGKII